jgi:N utilization substance protein A
MNALKPAEIVSIDLDYDNRRARVYVTPDQQSLAIGRRGQNVRLASELSNWDIDIVAVSREDIERLRTEDVEEGGDIGEVVGTARKAVKEEGEEAAGETEADASPEAVAEPASEPEAEEALLTAPTETPEAGHDEPGEAEPEEPGETSPVVDPDAPEEPTAPETETETPEPESHLASEPSAEPAKDP